jgi:succinate dehydrogenase / fumarate reductase iron-sulfur subunit
MAKSMRIKLKVWRQPNANTAGRFETYEANAINSDMSFLEMLDVVNADIERQGGDPIAFDHDCREGICGSCGAMVNGNAHGPDKGTTLCQLHMRRFNDGDTIVVEPFRSAAFPVVKDLAVNRNAFDRIIQSGGFVSVRTGSAQDANAIPIPKPDADRAFDAATCIGCGACVAACPNASAMLFVSAKVSHLNLLPQGRPEKDERAMNMLLAQDAEGFGNCSNEYECEAACPKEISVENIARLNRQFLTASFRTGLGE